MRSEEVNSQRIEIYSIFFGDLCYWVGAYKTWNVNWNKIDVEKKPTFISFSTDIQVV